MTRSDQRRSTLIILFAWLAYTLSYLGRSNYNACVLEIVTQTGATRSAAGMVTSVFSLCYLSGQLGSALLIKKFRPVKVISVELFTAAVINLLFPGSGSFGAMALLWGLNGCVQSTLLCSLTQIFVENLEEPYLSRSAVAINTVGAAGGALNYTLTWALLKYARWQAAFYVSGGFLLIFGLLWISMMPRLTKNARRPEPSPTSSAEGKTSGGFLSLPGQLRHYGAIAALFGCAGIGLLREGMSLWIPSYINDTYALGSAMSTVITVFVPLLQVVGAFLASGIHHRIYNLHFPVCGLFLLSGLCLFLLPLLGDLSLILTVGLFVCNAICSTITLTTYLSLFPLRFFHRSETSSIVAFSNFCMHIGALFASTGIGWFSENGGWRVTFGILAGFALLAALVSGIGGVFCRREIKARQ